MIARPFWINRIEQAWREAPVVWRDKAGHEVDFAIVRTRDSIDAFECKWDPGEFDPKPLVTFRMHYPKGRNHLVTPLMGPAYTKRFGSLEIMVCNPEISPANVLDAYTRSIR